MLENGFTLVKKGASSEALQEQGFTKRVADGFVRGWALLTEYNATDLPVAYTWETRAKDAMVMCRMLDGSWAVVVAGKIAATGDNRAEVTAEYAAVRNAPDYIRKANQNPTNEAKRLADVAQVVKDGKVTKGMRNAGARAQISTARATALKERVLNNLRPQS